MAFRIFTSVSHVGDILPLLLTVNIRLSILSCVALCRICTVACNMMLCCSCVVACNVVLCCYMYCAVLYISIVSCRTLL